VRPFPKKWAWTRSAKRRRYSGRERRRPCQSNQGRFRQGGDGSPTAEGDHNDVAIDRPPSAHGKREHAFVPPASGSAEKELPITGTDPFMTPSMGDPIAL
jgi:hypothetical protein